MYIETLSAPPDHASLTARPGHALARKLEHHAPLGSDECASLDRLLSRDIRRLHGRTDLVEQGGVPSEIQVIVDGWACRHAMLDGGRRRIVALYLPGDVCDFNVFVMTAIDQSITAIGPVRIAGINRATLNELSQTQPRISQGLWWESMTAAAIQRAWTINAGRRGAGARIANLLCELYARMDLVGLAEGHRCALPLTQADIADACALTSIHTNRAIQGLRSDGLITLADGMLTIHDFDALATLGEFDGAYLQTDRFRPKSLAVPDIMP